MHIESIRRARTISLVAIAMIFQGCMVLPVPQLPSEHATFIEDEKIASIEPGQSRRKDVYQQFGLPGKSYDGGSRWLFVTRSHRAGGVRVCGGILDPFTVLDNPNDSDNWEGAGGCSDKRNNRVVTYLDVEFDAAGSVKRSLLTTARKGGCDRSDICLDGDSLLVVKGSAEANSRAKLFQTSPDQCAVFLYSRNNANSTRIRVGKSRQMHQLHSDSVFMRFDLDAGVHKFDLAYTKKMELRSEVIEIDCAAGTSYFIQRQRSRQPGPTFTAVSTAAGKAQIQERYLVLARDGG